MAVTAMEVPIQVIEAMQAEHREEVAKLTMRIVTYRKALEDAGIEPPDHDEDALLSMWQTARAVVTTASHFVSELGSAKELLA